MNAKALQMLVPSGDPNGIKIIELAGWSGKCFVVPRQKLKELRQHEEVSHPGLYFLFGTNEEEAKKLVYIGESESFFSRISNHDLNKDFWDTAVIFTGGLNRAFVKYLEYQATTEAKETDRMVVENKVQPQENSLSDFEKVSVEQYFTNLKFTLGSIGFNLFVSSDPVSTMVDEYMLTGENIEAKAELLQDGSLKVLEGSLARVKETSSFLGWAKAARNGFIEDDTLKKDGDSYIYTKDVVFKSPSAAAATTAGRSVNGWTAWKDKEGKTLDENVRKADD